MAVDRAPRRIWRSIIVTAAVTIIDLHILRGARSTAISEPRGTDPIKDAVKLRFADLEGVMVPFETVPIVKIDRQRVVDAHRREMRDRPLVFEAEDVSEEPSGCFLVAGRNDRVVEDDGQERLLLIGFAQKCARSPKSASSSGSV